MELLDVIGSGNIHRCREIQPYEATTYSLQADNLEKFSAISKTELTIAVEGISQEQFSSLELPVSFSKESVTRVIAHFLLCPPFLAWHFLLVILKNRFLIFFKQPKSSAEPEPGACAAEQSNDRQVVPQTLNRVGKIWLFPAQTWNSNFRYGDVYCVAIAQNFELRNAFLQIYYCHQLYLTQQLVTNWAIYTGLALGWARDSHYLRGQQQCSWVFIHALDLRRREELQAISLSGVVRCWGGEFTWTPIPLQFWRIQTFNLAIAFIVTPRTGLMVQLLGRWCEYSNRLQ